MRISNRFYVILLVISGLVYICLKYTEDTIIVNIYKGWFNISYDHLPSYITSSRNYYEIADPVFLQGHDGEKYLNDESEKIKVEGFMLDYVLEDKSMADSISEYRINPKFSQNRFGHTFLAVETEVLAGDPNAIDDRICSNGIYVHDALYPLYSYCQEKEMDGNKYTIPIQAFLWSCSLRSKFDMAVTTPSFELLDEYIPGTRIYIEAPLLYLPFPLSGKGYMFSAKVLKDFNKMTEFFQDQNFYSILTYVTDDISRIGTIISCDDKGVLLAPEIRRTPHMKLHLYRIGATDNYAAAVYYKKSSCRKLLDKQSLQIIQNYSKLSSCQLEAYDKRIFSNMRKMLSTLVYEDVCNNLKALR